MSDANQTEHGATLEVTEARQGRRGRHALLILLISLVLVALALWGAWAFKARDLASVEPNGTSNTPGAAAFDAPAPQPKMDNPDTRAPTGEANETRVP